MLSNLFQAHGSSSSPPSLKRPFAQSATSSPPGAVRFAQLPRRKTIAGSSPSTTLDAPSTPKRLKRLSPFPIRRRSPSPSPSPSPGSSLPRSISHSPHFLRHSFVFDNYEQIPDAFPDSPAASTPGIPVLGHEEQPSLEGPLIRDIFDGLPDSRSRPLGRGRSHSLPPKYQKDGKNFENEVKKNERRLQRLAQGIFIAFEDDSGGQEPEQLKTPLGKDFTHLVKVVTSCDPSEIGTVNTTMDLISDTHILRIVVPDPDADMLDELEMDTADSRLTTTDHAMLIDALRDLAVDENDTTPDGPFRLTESQLIAARQFLSSSGHMVRRPEPHPDNINTKWVRILITTSRKCRSDAVGIAVCYFAAASGHSVRSILSQFNGRKEMLEVWRGVIGQDSPLSMFIEGAARK